MSWPLVKLGDVCERVSVGHVGTTSEFYTDEAGVPFLRTQNVGSDGVSLEDVKYITHEFHKTLRKSTLAANDVVMSRVVSTSVNCGIVPESLAGANCANIILARPIKDKLVAEYLVHYLRSSDVQGRLLARQVGSAQSVVNTGVLKSWEIPLPPLHEQKRIAAILDKADAIRRKRQQAIQLADDFLRAVFLDMFGDPVANPKGWEMKKWCSVLTIVNGRNQKTVEDDSGTYPICGSGGFMAKANDWLTEANSVIIGRKGNINSPILMKERFWNVDTAFGLEPKRAELSHNYLFWFCKFFDFERLNKAVTIPSLTKADLLQVDMPLPPREAQMQFDEVVERIDVLSAKYEKALSEPLCESLSQKAFSGQL